MRWLLITALLFPGLAHADSLQLTNGETYVGRLVEEGPVAVTISSRGAAWTFKRDHVATLSHDAAEADREEAQTRDRLQEAATDHARRLQEAADRKRAFAEANARPSVPPPQVVTVEPARGEGQCYRPLVVSRQTQQPLQWTTCPCPTVIRPPPPRIDYRWFN